MSSTGIGSITGLPPSLEIKELPIETILRDRLRGTSDIEGAKVIVETLWGLQFTDETKHNLIDIIAKWAEHIVEDN